MLIFPQHQIVVRIDKNQPNHAREADREKNRERKRLCVIKRNWERNTETKHRRKDNEKTEKKKVKKARCGEKTGAAVRQKRNELINKMLWKVMYQRKKKQIFLTVLKFIRQLCSAVIFSHHFLNGSNLGTRRSRFIRSGRCVWPHVVAPVGSITAVYLIRGGFHTMTDRGATCHMFCCSDWLNRYNRPSSQHWAQTVKQGSTNQVWIWILLHILVTRLPFLSCLNQTKLRPSLHV